MVVRNLILVRTLHFHVRVTKNLATTKLECVERVVEVSPWWSLVVDTVRELEVLTICKRIRDRDTWAQVELRINTCKSLATAEWIERIIARAIQCVCIEIVHTQTRCEHKPLEEDLVLNEECSSCWCVWLFRLCLCCSRCWIVRLHVEVQVAAVAATVYVIEWRTIPWVAI